MRGGRLIVVIGVFMGIVAGVLVILMMSRGTTTTIASPTPQPVSIVRAAQNIAKGTEISLDAIQLVRLESGEATPPDAVKDPMEVAGMTASMDIPQGTIIQEEMYFDREAMAEEGEGASTLFQPGRVAMAVPIGQLSGIAGAITVGDHVDVIAAFEFVDIDSEVQAMLPIDGSYEQLPHLEAQVVLQNLEVLRVGEWGTGPAEGGEEQSSADADVLTLLMPQQDALVMEWLLVKLQEEQAQFTLVLRSQEDDEIVSTDPATLDYMMKRFRIMEPPHTPVTTERLEVSGSIEPR